MPFRHNAEKRLKKLYDTLPKLNCQKKCKECCGPILMSPLEEHRITRSLGYLPIFANPSTMKCPMLDSANGTCKIYDLRPAICRIWGLTKQLACPFGCVPERWMPDAEAREFLRQVERLSRT